MHILTLKGPVAVSFLWNRAGLFSIQEERRLHSRRYYKFQTIKTTPIGRRSKKFCIKGANKRRDAKCSDAGSLHVLRRILLTPLPDRAARRLCSPGSINPKVLRSNFYFTVLSDYCNINSNQDAYFLGIFNNVLQLLSPDYPQT